VLVEKVDHVAKAVEVPCELRAAPEESSIMLLGTHPQIGDHPPTVTAVPHPIPLLVSKRLFWYYEFRKIFFEVIIRDGDETLLVSKYLIDLGHVGR